MSLTEHFWYGDEATRRVLAGKGSRVLLLGSCGGYANFGDVLQLKGAIDWHRQHTRLDPVVVFHASAISDSGFVERQRRIYGVEAILLWSPKRYELSALGLAEISTTQHIERLHVYGGGFLNRFWGRGTVAIIESLIARFGVGHYVISGQQVDELFVPELREHFQRYRPLIAGGRDATSARLLAACGVEAQDSFDDAAELLDRLAAQQGHDHGSCDLLLHMNTSYYTGPDEYDQLGEVLRRVAAIVARGRSAAPRVTLLHAYNDSRVEEVVDTLGAVQRLEHRFPFASFDVIDLSQVATRFGVSGERPVALPIAPLAISCSYHVSILLSRLGVPCYLLSRNAYYDQKRGGLGMKMDLDEFLAAPRATDLSARFAVRPEWSRRLSRAFEVEPEIRDVTVAAADSVATKFVLRGQAPGGARGDSAANSAEYQSIIAGFEERGRHIAELRNAVTSAEAESRRLWNELQSSDAQRLSLVAAYEHLRGRIAAVEAECRTLWEQLQEAERTRLRLVDGFEERGRRVVELEAELARVIAESQKLWDDLRRVTGGFEERGRRVRELERMVGRSDESSMDAAAAK